MGIESLSAKEQDIVLRCMKATSAHLDDWGKHSRWGLEDEDLQQVIADGQTSMIAMKMATTFLL
jgi:hypothetical protein